MFLKQFPIILFVMVGACSSNDRIDPKIETLGRATGPVNNTGSRPEVQAKPPVHGMGQMPPPTSPEEVEGSPTVVKGRILETMDASRYTYVHLQDPSGEAIWAAIPQTPLEVGKPVEIVQSIVMKNFESKTLKRTFPSIVFGVLKEASIPPPPEPDSKE